MTELIVGQNGPDQAALRDAPLGSVVNYGEHRSYHRLVDGWWDENGAHTSHVHLIDSRYTVVSVGIRHIDDTLASFQQRLRTASIGNIRQAGMDRTPVERALNDLGVPLFDGLYEGMFVHFGDNDTLGRLPDDTLLFWGEEDRWQWQSVRHWSSHRGLRHLIGGQQDTTGKMFQVIQFPPDTMLTDWPDPTGDDAAAIVALKRQIWDIGVVAKASNSWCLMFEMTMSSMGIDAHVPGLPETSAEVPNSPAIGDTLTTEQVRSLPNGSVVKWNAGDVFFVRDDESADARNNQMRTRGIRPHEGHWSSSGVTLVHLGDGTVPNRVDVDLPVTSVEEMIEMPIGTRMVQRDSMWRKTARDFWTLRRGTGGSGDSGSFIRSDTLRYQSIPTTEREAS